MIEDLFIRANQNILKAVINRILYRILSVKLSEAIEHTLPRFVDREMDDARLYYLLYRASHLGHKPLGVIHIVPLQIP